MSEKSDQKLLKKLVIEKSKSDAWEDAKKEWKLLTIFDDPGNCICKHAIVENCVIKNKHNHNELVVGNVCINKFEEDELKIPKASRVSLKKLHKDRVGSKATAKLLDLAFKLKILTEYEVRSYKNYRNDKSEISEEHRLKCNNLIIYGFASNRPKCQCDEYAKPRKGPNGYFYSCFNGYFDVFRQWITECPFTQRV